LKGSTDRIHLRRGHRPRSRGVTAAGGGSAPLTSPSISGDKGGPMKEQRAGKGISRRSMLKRLGVGAAVAWSAPVLTSLRTPAWAQYGLCPDCVDCTFMGVCGTDCACVGVPSPDCFCASFGFCTSPNPVCATDEDCGPGARCAPCVFAECVETSCWFPCGSPRAVPTGEGVHVLRPSR
jgi:hypothetical protein